MRKVCLIVGKSESGKTTLAKRLLEGVPGPVRVVNDKTGHFEAATATPGGEKFQSASWEELAKLKNCAVLVEDLIGTTPAEFAALQHLVSYKCHHDSVSPAVLVTHSIQKNNLQGILNYLTHVYFTASKCNVKSLRVVLDDYDLDKRQKESFRRDFRANAEPYGHFCLDVERGTFERVRSPSETAATTTRRLPEVPRISPARYLEHTKNPEKALLVFDIVNSRLPQSALGDEYTVKLESKLLGHPVTVSLIDYADCATDVSKTPSKELCSFHRYVSSIAHLPSCLVDNKKFRN
jgi:hypothetical protein